MARKQRILFVGETDPAGHTWLSSLAESVDAVQVPTLLRALALLSREHFNGIFVDSAHLSEAAQVGKLLQNEWILEEMPDAVLLLDSDNTIIWANCRFGQWCDSRDLAGKNFYEALGFPEILGPDYCPIHTALVRGETTTSTLRFAENRYFQIHATPVASDGDSPKHLLVIARDVTSEMMAQQKLVAIHQAGIELADLKPEELATMSVEERIDLMKSNILHFTQDLLQYETIEIRLLDRETGKLEPLLAVGMQPVACDRQLFAVPQSNGVTGFVAATGKSYLCEDTSNDPLYLEGAAGAKSSMTVPLIFHDEVIGTFNVESPEKGAFSERDLQFLEIFARDVGAALHTLELLVAEKATSTAKSVEAIHSAVALPIDDILNDTVNVIERYIGHEPEVVDKLRRILRNARDIKEVIQKVGRKMAPAQALPLPLNPEHESRPKLHGKQVLVVDPDDSVREAAHSLLERYGCVVETAHDGVEAVLMVRSGDYEAILADIRLPDMSGYDLLVRLQETIEDVPMILMTGFGYDPGHSIVKARQAGLKHVLYKPFRLDQLLESVEEVTPIPGLAQQD